jgi:hypothetical protein
VDRPTVIRARLARAVRIGEAAEVVTELPRDYYAARAYQTVRGWLSSDPAPTPEHRREVAALLAGGEADGTPA